MPMQYFRCDCQHCAGHIEFPVEAVGTTADCPHCGQPTALTLPAPPPQRSVPAKTIVFAVLALAILAAGVIGTQVALRRARRLAGQQQTAGGANGTTTSTPGSSARYVSQAGFRVSPVKIEKTDGSSLTHAIGTVRNESDKRRFGVKVEIELLDASGSRIGTAKDYQQTIEPRAEWQFRALVVGGKAVSARLVSISEDQ